MSPAKNQRRSSQSRIGIIQAVQTPLGFFVLVVLVVEVIFGIVAGLRPDADRTYLIRSMVALIFFVVLVVAFLAYREKGLNSPGPKEELSTAIKYSLLIGPPDDMPQFDIAIIEWKDEECFLIGRGIKEPVTLVPTRIGPSFRVQISHQTLEKLKPDEPVELRLMDAKGHCWKVKRFFIFENLLPLSWGEDRELVLKDYSDQLDEQ